MSAVSRAAAYEPRRASASGGRSCGADSSLCYFQSYRLAYDLAKRAEQCFRFELGLRDGSYINFGYWNSLKKGLLSGENLQYDLRRLETTYLMLLACSARVEANAQEPAMLGDIPTVDVHRTDLPPGDVPSTDGDIHNGDIQTGAAATFVQIMMNLLVLS